MAAASGRQVSWARRLWLLGVAVGLALAACSDQSSTPESTGQSSQALTSAQQRILGFESIGPNSTDWTTTSGTLSQSTRHVDGTGSLAIANGGNAEIKSAALTSLGPVADKVTLDLLLPAAQPNPNWMGTLKLVIECPSQQLSYEGLAEYQLQGRATEQFLRFEFPLSATTRQKLSSGTYSDLRFKILLNVPSGAGPWLLDRLWLADSSGGGSGGSGGVAGGAGAGAGMSGGGQAGGASVTTNNAAILGFETPALWSGSAGVLNSSDVHLEGTHALQVTNVGYVELTSAPLTTLGAIGSVSGFDLSVPNPVGDVGWWGSAAVSIDCPSRGINNRWLGQQELNGATLDLYRRVEVILPEDVTAALSTGSYTDLRVKVILTVPVGSGPYLLDRFTFDSQLPEPAPPAPSDAVDKALGMETLESWKATAATLRLSSTAAERASSIAVSDFQYTEVSSTRLSSLGSPLKNELTVDVWIPAPPTLYWAGSIAASISIPSKGINSQFIGQQDVLSLERDAWQRVRFPLTAALVTALQGSYSDLRVTFALNRPVQPGAWKLDRVSFGQKWLSTPTPAFTETYVIPLPAAFTFDTVAIGQALVRSAPFFRAGGSIDILGSPLTAIKRADGQFSDVVAPRGIDDDEANVLVGLGASLGSVSAFRNITNDGTVHGNARAGGAVTGVGAFTGATASHVDLLSREAGKLIVAFPDGSGAPDVAVNGINPSSTPAPGASYDFVSSTTTGSITLRTGSYYFNHLSIGRGTELRLDNANGPILVYVRDSFAVRGTVSLVDRAKWNVLFVVTAVDDVTIAHDSHFEGTVVAPKTSNLRIDPDNDPSEPAYTAGSFFGREVFGGYKIEHHPFVRDDCSAGSCGTFGCDTADRDGDGLYDCQEELDGDPFTDPDQFNGLRAYGYRSSHRSVDPAAIDTPAKVDASIVEKFEEHDIYSGWNLDGQGLLDVGCRREMDFWPPWPVCHEASYPGFNYSGFIKLATSGQHCFEIAQTSTSIAGALFLGAEPGLTSSDGKRCMNLEAGVYPLRFMVEVVGLQDVNSLADDHFKVAYCAGDCTPIDAIPQSMLRPTYTPPSCAVDADCADGNPCVDGQCCARDCSNRPCGAVSNCGTVCSILDSSCVPDTSTCGTSNFDDSNPCTADACDAAGRVLHYFRPQGFVCEGGRCDGAGLCNLDDTRGGRGQPPKPDHTCNAGLLVGQDNGGYFAQSAELDLCWDPVCELAAGAHCGWLGALCGVCPGTFPPVGTCETTCASKHCGDDPDDGCGGTCALCGPGESGCLTDADCQLGYQCAIGKGARFGLSPGENVCWPEICNSINPQTIPCGSTGSQCGLCPVCQPVCDGVGCGSDGCGGTCGCASGEYCDSHQECAPVVRLLEGDLPPDFINPDQYTTTSVGTLSGQFEVSPDGRSTYQVPVTVPPGRGGMQPTLSLSYDSGLGDGALGQGWSVKGLSTISLCAKTVAQDGYAHGIASSPAPDNSRDSRPRYCLDGVRLQLVDGDEGKVGGVYFTETDTHQKIVITDVDEAAPPNRKVTEFKVYHSDARITTFTITDGPNGWYWLPSRVEDRSGNFMRIEYLQRDVQCTASEGGISCPENDIDVLTLVPQVEILPTKVWYAGHDGLDPDTLVEFKYEFRTDGRRGLRSGVWLNQTHLLSTVAVSLGGNPVREYRLEYEHRDTVDRTLLTKMSECAPNQNNPADVVCKTPTVFDYDTTPVGLSGAIPIGTSPNDSAEGFYEPPDDLVLDMNNDGVDDLLMQVNDRRPVPFEFFTDRHYEILWGGQRLENTGLAVEPLTDAGDRAVIDYNADGRDDVLIVPFQAPGNYRVLTYTQSGEFSVVDTGVPSAWANSTEGFDHAQTYVLDADGDGVRDIVSCQGRTHGVDDSGPWTWRLVHVPDMTVRNVDFQGNCFTHYLPISTDGSGAQQLLMQSFFRDASGALVNKDAYVAISFQNAEPTDSGPVKVTTTLTSCPVAERKGIHGIPLDANGDGLTDILVSDPTGNRPPPPSQPGHVDVGYQNGLGICFGAGTTDRVDASTQRDPLFVTRAGVTLFVSEQTQPFLLGPVMDVNGDGRDDIVVTSRDSTVWKALTLSNDTALDSVLNHSSLGVVPIAGFAPPALWLAPGSVYVKQLKPEKLLAGRSLAMDVNGDGLQDFVQKSAATWDSSQLSAFIRTGPRTPLLTRVTNGLGATTEVAYGQLTAAELPDEEDPLAPFFPARPIQFDAGDVRNCGVDTQLGCRQPRHSVVSAVRTFQGSDASVATEYEHSYGGPRVGLGGRGWLGFASHVVNVPAMAQSLTYEFDNVTRDSESGLFPFANYVVKLTQETSIQRGENTVQRVSTVRKEPGVVRSPTVDRVLFVYDHVVTTSVHEIGDGDDELSASRDVIEVDEFGNVKSDDLEWGAGHVEHELITTHYKHEGNAAFLESWLINLPTSRTQTSQVGSDQQADYTREVSADYDDNGLPKSFVVEPSRPAYRVEKDFTRDDYGALSSVTTIGGDETRTSYVVELDERKVFPRVVSDAEGYQTKFEVSSRLGVATTATSLGRDGQGLPLTKENVTDGFGRRRVVIEEDGRIATTSYDFGSDGASGMRVTYEAAGFPTSTTELDRNGRSISQANQVLGGANLVSAVRYDELGRIQAASRPAVEGTLADPFEQSRTFAYDNLGRTLATANADGSERHYCFNARITCAEDEVHRVTCADHDARGRVTFAADPIQGDAGDCDAIAADFKNTPDDERQGLKYSYGPFGFQERVTRGSTILTDARQDQLGRVHTRTDLGLAQKTYTYTPFGKLETEETAQDTTTWRYDALDRVRFRTDSSGESEWSWRDDMPGRIDFTQTSGDDQTVRTAGYDEVGRMNSLTRTIHGEDFVLSVLDRDDFGHAKTVSYPAAGDVPFEVENLYDSTTGILSEVRSVPNSPDEQVVSFWKLSDITAFGQVKTEVFGNGAATTERGYFDLTGRIQSITTDGGGARVEDLAYTYYDDGNVETRTDGLAGRSESFTYDELARLDTVDSDGEEVADYDYNGFGSLKNNGHDWSYAYLGTQPQSVHSISDGALESVFTYSDDGYLKHRSAGPLPELNVEYSSFGKPLREWGGAEADAVSFSYDADQQKVARVAPGETTLFFDDIYYRMDIASSNEIVHHYVVSNGQRAVAEVSRVDGESSMDVRFLHEDSLGSVVALTSIAGAAETRSFDHFGASIASDFSNLGYTGHHDEGVAGLIDMRGRTYDPLVGQFLQPDPIVSEPYTIQGFNHYSYVNNNPLRLTDPSGFQSCGDELSAACRSFVPDPTPQPVQSAPIPEPNTGPRMSMMSTPPPGGGMLSSIESGSDPAASGRAFSTESSAASGQQSLRPNLASILPPHLQWNGQPLRYFMGTAHHVEIAAFYTEANLPNVVLSNSIPLSDIAARLGGDVSLLPGGVLMPDIVNLTTRVIYEIKPLWMSGQGAQDLANYIEAAAATNVVLTPGGPGPGTSGMLIYPSGYAIEFGWAAPGLIVYQETIAPPIWERVPVPREDPSPVSRWTRLKVDPTTAAVGAAAAGGTVVIGGMAWYYWATLPVLVF